MDYIIIPDNKSRSHIYNEISESFRKCKENIIIMNNTEENLKILQSLEFSDKEKLQRIIDIQKNMNFEYNAPINEGCKPLFDSELENIYWTHGIKSPCFKNNNWWELHTNIDMKYKYTIEKEWLKIKIHPSRTLEVRLDELQKINSRDFIILDCRNDEVFCQGCDTFQTQLFRDKDIIQLKQAKKYYDQGKICIKIGNVKYIADEELIQYTPHIDLDTTVNSYIDANSIFKIKLEEKPEGVYFRNVGRKEKDEFIDKGKQTEYKWITTDLSSYTPLQLLYLKNRLDKDSIDTSISLPYGISNISYPNILEYDTEDRFKDKMLENELFRNLLPTDFNKKKYILNLPPHFYYTKPKESNLIDVYMPHKDKQYFYFKIPFDTTKSSALNAKYIKEVEARKILKESKEGNEQRKFGDDNTPWMGMKEKDNKIKTFYYEYVEFQGYDTIAWNTIKKIDPGIDTVAFIELDENEKEKSVHIYKMNVKKITKVPPSDSIAVTDNDGKVLKGKDVTKQISQPQDLMKKKFYFVAEDNFYQFTVSKLKIDEKNPLVTFGESKYYENYVRLQIQTLEEDYNNFNNSWFFLDEKVPLHVKYALELDEVKSRLQEYAKEFTATKYQAKWNEYKYKYKCALMNFNQAHKISYDIDNLLDANAAEEDDENATQIKEKVSWVLSSEKKGIDLSEENEVTGEVVDDSYKFNIDDFIDPQNPKKFVIKKDKIPDAEKKNWPERYDVEFSFQPTDDKFAICCTTNGTTPYKLKFKKTKEQIKKAGEEYKFIVPKEDEKNLLDGKQKIKHLCTKIRDLFEKEKEIITQNIDDLKELDLDDTILRDKISEEYYIPVSIGWDRMELEDEPEGNDITEYVQDHFKSVEGEYEVDEKYKIPFHYKYFQDVEIQEGDYVKIEENIYYVCRQMFINLVLEDVRPKYIVKDLIHMEQSQTELFAEKSKFKSLTSSYLCELKDVDTKDDSRARAKKCAIITKANIQENFTSREIPHAWKLVYESKNDQDLVVKNKKDYATVHANITFQSIDGTPTQYKLPVQKEIGYTVERALYDFMTSLCSLNSVSMIVHDSDSDTDNQFSSNDKISILQAGFNKEFDDNMRYVEVKPNNIADKLSFEDFVGEKNKESKLKFDIEETAFGIDRSTATTKKHLIINNEGKYQVCCKSGEESYNINIANEITEKSFISAWNEKKITLSHDEYNQWKYQNALPSNPTDEEFVKIPNEYEWTYFGEENSRYNIKDRLKIGDNDGFDMFQRGTKKIVLEGFPNVNVFPIEKKKGRDYEMKIVTKTENLNQCDLLVIHTGLIIPDKLKIDTYRFEKKERQDKRKIDKLLSNLLLASEYFTYYKRQTYTSTKVQISSISMYNLAKSTVDPQIYNDHISIKGKFGKKMKLQTYTFDDPRHDIEPDEENEEETRNGVSLVKTNTNDSIAFIIKLNREDLTFSHVTSKDTVKYQIAELHNFNEKYILAHAFYSDYADTECKESSEKCRNSYEEYSKEFSYYFSTFLIHKDNIDIYRDIKNIDIQEGVRFCINPKSSKSIVLSNPYQIETGTVTPITMNEALKVTPASQRKKVTKNTLEIKPSISRFITPYLKTNLTIFATKQTSFLQSTPETSAKVSGAKVSDLNVERIKNDWLKLFTNR